MLEKLELESELATSAHIVSDELNFLWFELNWLYFSLDSKNILSL